MTSVSTAPGSTRNTWTCPTCRHGSPDPRDELAHLDAHRQLGRFLQEWDAAVVSDRENERCRRPRAVVAAALSVLVALVAGALVWGLAFNTLPPRRGVAPVPGSTGPRTEANRAPRADLPPVAAAPSPATPQPVADAPAPQPDAVLPTQGSPQPRAPSAVASTESVARNPVAGVTAPGPSTASSVSALEAPAAAPPASPVSALEPVLTRPAPLPPTYLARVCVLGTCLTVG